jgi:hypothetical protein
MSQPSYFPSMMRDDFLPADHRGQIAADGHTKALDQLSQIT